MSYLQSLIYAQLSIGLSLRMAYRFHTTEIQF